MNSTTAPSSSPHHVVSWTVSFYVALSLLVIAAIVYAWLAIAQKRIELHKEEDRMRLNRMAQHRNKKEGTGDNWRGRPSACMIAESMSKMDQWVYENAKELKNFISNALLFFAIPNMFLLAIMQNNFRAALNVLIEVSFFLSIAIFCGILYYSSFGSPNDGKCGKHFVAENKYEHLGLPLIDVVVLAVGQLTLLSLYYWSLFKNGVPPFDKLDSYLYYWLGVVMQLTYAHDNKIWKDVKHHCLFWVATLRARREDDIFYSSEDSARVTYSLRDDKFLHVRFILSSLVNTWGCFIIMMGVPLQVATQDNPMDFVLNVVAGFYIIEWDDLDDGQTEDYMSQMIQKDQDGGESTIRTTSGLPNISYTSRFAEYQSNEFSLGDNGSKRSLGESRSKRDIMVDDLHVLQSKVDELDILKQQIAKLASRVSEMDNDNEESELDLVDFEDCESGPEGAFENTEASEGAFENTEASTSRKVRFDS